MTESVADQLALLVRERADGRISIADYRRLRAPLLDRLVTHMESAIDEASLVTRPRVVTRVPEQDLGAVFAPQSRMGLWTLCLIAGAVILAIGWKMDQPPLEAAKDEIEPVRVTSRPAADAPSPSVRPEIRKTRERSLLQPPATDSEPRIIMLPRQAAGTVLGVSARAISQAQFRAYCDQTGHPFPRQPWDDGDPAVANVTWDEANDYARWLSSETGQRYRLPTEAEWLHAARTLGARSGFNVGKVREWVADEWVGEIGSAPVSGQRVVRGISYADDATSLLSARRNRPGTIRDALTGFRIVRETP